MPIRVSEADLLKPWRSLTFWRSLVCLWLGSVALFAHADCYDPAGASAVAGQFRYMTDYKEFRHCDGTYWQSMATRTTIAGACSAGTMAVTSGDLRMCNGSEWVSMTGISTGVCTTAIGSVVWDSTSKQMRYCNGSNRQVGLQISDAAAVVSSASPWLQVYDMSNGSLRGAPASPATSTPYAVSYSPSGKYLAIGQFSLPFIRVYDVSLGMSAVSVGTLPEMATSFSWKPDGTRLAVGIYSSPYFTVYDTSTWTRLSTTNVPPPPNQARGVSYHPTQDLIATIGGTSPYLVFYDTTTLPYTKPALVTGGNVITTAGGAIAFSPNGRYLAVGLDNSPFLVIYKTSDWSKIGPIAAPTSKVRALAWHPDSSKLVTGSTTGTLLNVHSAEDWTMSAPFDVQPTGPVAGVSFNSRGTILGVTMVDNAPNYFTYETYTWTKLTNVSVQPNVDTNKNVYGVSFRPGQ